MSERAGRTGTKLDSGAELKSNRGGEGRDSLNRAVVHGAE